MTASALSSISASSHRKRQASTNGRRRGKVSLAGPSWLTNPMPALGREQAVVVAHRVVPCPFDGRPLGVEVNRRVDVLAQERAAGRIGDDHFLVGRMIQAIYERSSGARLGSSGWNISGSRDQTIAHELAIIYAIEDAERVRKFTARLEAAIGAVGTRFLRAILAEGQTFAVYAARTGKGSGDRAATEIAKRFRWLLETLTEEQHTATGAEGQFIRGTREIAK